MTTDEQAARVINERTILVGVDKLEPHPRNPRVGNVDVIAESIRHNGFYGVIVAQKSSGYVVAGNHRLKAARQVGLAKVPVVYVDVGDDEAIDILLADNRTSDVATYNHESLLQLLNEVQERRGALTGTGYDQDALRDLLGRVKREQQRIAHRTGDAYPDRDTGDAESLAAMQGEWKTELGQVWQAGDHRVIIGDTTDPETWTRLLGGVEPFMCLTSPPYWVGKEYEREHSWDDVLAVMQQTSMLMAEHTHSRIVINTGTVNAGKLRGMKTHYRLLLDDWQAFLEQYGWLMRHARIWSKTGTVMEMGMSPKADIVDMSWEFIACFYKPETFRAQNKVSVVEDLQAKHGRNGAGGGTGWTQMGTWDVHDLPKASRGTDAAHPAPFDVELPSRYLMLYTHPGEAVIDPFLGSGTTLLAAHQLGRVGYGIELDPRFAALSLQRLADEGLTPKLL